MSGATRLRLRVAEAVRRHGLWAPGDRVAVAVSGGLDSVVLLDVLAETRGVHRGRLSVVTVDHGTRPGSAEDARFVARLSRRRGLPCHVATRALGPGATERACRDARYAVLDALDVDRVALAHHRDDQAETLLIALLRGHGARGLAGMARRRGRYVRPLLDAPRRALEAYADARGLAWREDPTNADGRWLRNRVRHRLRPLLEDLRPGASHAVARTAQRLAEDDALLDVLSREADPHDGVGWPTAWVAEAPIPLVRRALLRRLPGARGSHLDAILDAARRGRGRIPVTFRVCVVVDPVLVHIEGGDPDVDLGRTPLPGLPRSGAGAAPEGSGG